MIAKYATVISDLRKQINDQIIQGIDKLPTEAELCKKYNVSRQTVRKALSILADEKLIERKQGSGSVIAARLISKRVKKVALLLPSSKDYIYPRLISDISSSLKANGYDFTIYITDDNVGNERNILTSLLESNFSAIISQMAKSALPNPNLDLYRRFADIQVPVLFILNSLDNTISFPYICLDDVLAGFMAAKFLTDYSCRTIAGLYNRDDRAGIERYQGMLSHLNDSHILPNDDNIFWYGSRELRIIRHSEDANLIIRSIFDPMMIRQMLKCSGIIVGSDEIAYYLIKALKRAGADIPDRIKIISFDNSYLSDFESEGFISIGSEDSRLGQIIVSITMKIINRQPFDYLKLTPKIQ